MTVNERLYFAWLTDDFDISLKQKNLEGFKLVLKKVDLDEDSISIIINSLDLTEN